MKQISDTAASIRAIECVSAGLASSFFQQSGLPYGADQALRNKFLAASLLAMKYSVLKDRLDPLNPTILKLAREIDQNVQTSLIVYTFVNSAMCPKTNKNS